MDCVPTNGQYEDFPCQGAEQPDEGTRHSPLPGRLEEEPLEESELVVLVRHAELVLLVVLLDEVEEDRVGLPDNEVVVLVVHKRRDTPVRVQLRVLRRLLLALAEVEVNALVGEPELLKDERDFPVNSRR